MPPMLSDDELSNSDLDQIGPAAGGFRRKGSATPDDKKPVSIDDDEENEDVRDIDQQDDEEDEEDDEVGEDVFVVEAILNHIIGENGKPTFQVKWEGYDKKSDLTWEPEDNLLGSASLILNNYYESVGGRNFVLSSGGAKPKKKRGRQANPGTPDLKLNGKKAKRSHPASSTPPASVAAEWKPPTGSWEEDIASIDAIEESDGKLSVYVQWSDGRQSQHEVRAMYSHCPQKMLKFYESHLVFKPGGGTLRKNNEGD